MYPIASLSRHMGWHCVQLYTGYAIPGSPANIVQDREKVLEIPPPIVLSWIVVEPIDVQVGY